MRGEDRRGDNTTTIYHYLPFATISDLSSPVQLCASSTLPSYLCPPHDVIACALRLESKVKGHLINSDLIVSQIEAKEWRREERGVWRCREQRS